MKLTEADVNILESIHIQHLSGLVMKYKDSYMPELYECTGRTSGQLAERYQGELDDFVSSKTYLPIDSRVKNIPQIKTILQIAANKSYNEARDWSENPYIKMRALRRCIRYVQHLKEIHPDAEIYSNMALCGIRRNVTQ